MEKRHCKCVRLRIAGQGRQGSKLLSGIKFVEAAPVVVDL